MRFLLVIGKDTEVDIDHILEWSVLRFGVSVRDGYQALMMAAFASIARNPDLP